jgi:D-3-phosphoglycerate dehydrogenase
MHIVIPDGLSSSAIELLTAHHGWIVDAAAGRPRDELLRKMATADALIVRSATRVDAELIAAAPILRVIGRAGTGVDNIDLDAAGSRGILVVNSPGANSVSVAEQAFALMLSLARSIAAADAAMKKHQWEKRHLVGAELRGKTLGVVGLGRIGQEVAARAHSFGMTVVAHDPYIAAHVAEELDVALVSLDELCERSDYVTLHVPATPETRHLFDAARLARCRPGIRLINTARGTLIDEAALVAAIESGRVGGAGLDVFATEPPTDWRLASLPQVVATPHIAASTVEAQELIGLETATSVRDYLRDGVVRNAVNFPSIPAEEFKRLQPYMVLGARLGSLLAQLADGRTEKVGIRYYGELATGNNELVATSVLMGVFRTMLSTAVTPVNARAVAAARGIEVVESRSSRHRPFTSLLSVKLHTDHGERWVEGTSFEHGSARLVLLDGVAVEAPLEGTMVVMRNNDQPGVIGDVGSILGRHGVNIATFALGRDPGGAVGVVNVDERQTPDGWGQVTLEVIREIRGVPAVREAKVIRL